MVVIGHAVLVGKIEHRDAATKRTESRERGVASVAAVVVDAGELVRERSDHRGRIDWMPGAYGAFELACGFGQQPHLTGRAAHVERDSFRELEVEEREDQGA